MDNDRQCKSAWYVTTHDLCNTPIDQLLVGLISNIVWWRRNWCGFNAKRRSTDMRPIRWRVWSNHTHRILIGIIILLCSSSSSSCCSCVRRSMHWGFDVQTTVRRRRTLILEFRRVQHTYANARARTVPHTQKLNTSFCTMNVQLDPSSHNTNFAHFICNKPWTVHHMSSCKINRLIDWLGFNGTFSTIRLYRALKIIV